MKQKEQGTAEMEKANRKWGWSHSRVRCGIPRQSPHVIVDILVLS